MGVRLWALSPLCPLRMGIRKKKKKKEGPLSGPPRGSTPSKPASQPHPTDTLAFVPVWDLGAGKDRGNVKVGLKPETNHSDKMLDQTHGSKHHQSSLCAEATKTFPLEFNCLLLSGSIRGSWRIALDFIQYLWTSFIFHVSGVALYVVLKWLGDW